MVQANHDKVNLFISGNYSPFWPANIEKLQHALAIERYITLSEIKARKIKIAKHQKSNQMADSKSKFLYFETQ